MDTKDLELKLCSDDPIYVAGVPIYPIPIRRIAQIGYMRFNSELRLLCLTEDDIKVLTGDYLLPLQRLVIHCAVE